VIQFQWESLEKASRTLDGHLSGTSAKPEDPTSRTLSSNAKELGQYLQEPVIVFQQIASTILDSLYLKKKKKPTVKEGTQS
jgi:hypothetical protein